MKKRSKLMKHIRRFNESKYDEVNDLIEGSLAYLADEGYEFNIRAESYGKNNRFIFLLYKDYQFMNWEDIKDYFIPFLERLKDKCEITELPLYIDGAVSRYRYIDEDPKNRTIRFIIPPLTGLKGSILYYYTDISNVIKNIDVPEKFTQIQILFKLK